MHLLNPFWFRFPKKIETKEEMISFLENNQEELEDFDDAPEYVESVQGMYEHRTERIVGNWYYFQQQWCSSTPF